MPDNRGTDADTAAPLIVWSADAQAAAPLIGMLEEVRLLDQCDDLPRPAQVETGAKAPEMLLFCYSAIETLCRAMAGGTPPSVALESWKTGAAALLAVNRRNRRRVHILDLGRVIGDPGAVLRRFGWRDDAAEGCAQAEVVPEAPDEVLVLLAQHCLAQDARAVALVAEMAALVAQGHPIADDPDAAFQSYRETCRAHEEAELLRTQMRPMQEEAELLRAQMRPMQEEAELLRTQMQPMQEEAELLRTQMQLTFEEMELLQQQNRAAHEEAMTQGENALHLEQRVAQLNQGIESYQAQLETVQATAAGLGKKVAEKESAMKVASAMLRDLETQADELAGALARARAGRAEMAQMADTLRQRIQQIETSYSYRLTGPLRRIRALISGPGRGAA